MHAARDNRCAGGASGALIALARGAVEPVAYRWSNGRRDPELRGLRSGVYGVTVTDSGCTVSAVGVVSEPSPLQLSLQVTDNKCAEGRSGSVLVKVAGGTFAQPSEPLLRVEPRAESVTVQGLFVTGLPVGNFSLSVEDDFGCVASVQAHLRAPDPPFKVSNQQHRTLWADLCLTLCHVCTREYRFYYHRSGFRSSYLSSPLLFFSILSLVLPRQVAIAKEVRCANGSTLIATPKGGAPPFQHLWYRGKDELKQATVEAMQGESFTVVATDANGCVARDWLRFEPLRARFVDQGPCTGGSLEVVPTGGVPPYYYDWNGVRGASVAFNLKHDMRYTAVVSDSEGCRVSLETVLVVMGSHQPQRMLLSKDVTDAQCPGQNGLISLRIAQGTLSPPPSTSCSHSSYPGNVHSTCPLPASHLTRFHHTRHASLQRALARRHQHAA
jgi:hypothetical protein